MSARRVREWNIIDEHRTHASESYQFPGENRRHFVISSKLLSVDLVRRVKL
jgi:hypothetical protein